MVLTALARRMSTPPPASDAPAGGASVPRDCRAHGGCPTGRPGCRPSRPSPRPCCPGVRTGRGPWPAVKLKAQDAPPAVFPRAGAAGEGEGVGPLGAPADGAGLHGRGADLLVAQHAEQLAEALDALFQHAVESLGGDIAPGDPG